LKDGLSPKVVANALGILRRVCSLHVSRGLLAANPLIGVGRLVSRAARRYEHEVRQVDSWTAEERAKILEVAREWAPHLYPFLVLSFHTGSRTGEAIAVQWEDVDLSSRRIRVRRNRVRGEQKGPKTDRARFVPISDLLADVGTSRRESP